MLRPKAHATAFMRQQHLKRYCEAAPSLVASATQRIAVQKKSFDCRILRLMYNYRKMVIVTIEIPRERKQECHL